VAGRRLGACTIATVAIVDEARQMPSNDSIIDQPGLVGLRNAVARRIRHPSGSGLRREAVAGMTVAVSSIPDAMAAGIVAGVNPMYGLDAAMIGPIVGGLFSSTQLMVITTTSATALVAAQALLSSEVLAGLSASERDQALFLMVLLSGLFQIVFGLLRLGRMTRFVSFSVMTGFLAGVATLLILSQLPVISGFSGQGENRVLQTYDMITRAREADVPSLVLAALTAGLMLAFSRTRFNKVGNLIAIAVASGLLYVVGLDAVQTVDDDIKRVENIAQVQRILPVPDMPSLATAVYVVTGALSLAIVILVQGAGVSQSVPNPDGKRSSLSGDFIAQGAANVASGLLRGLPVGGSLSTTAVNVGSGAKRRWGAVLGGIFVGVIVLAVPGLIGNVAMPALGALLILAGLNSIKPADVHAVWDAGWPARLASLSTFIATLTLPIQVAVGIGVVLSALLVVNESAAGITVVQLVEREDGALVETPPPPVLQDNRTTVLDVYGHLFYAGARTLERRLPSARGAKRPVVILRLRGRTALGATVIEVLAKYSRDLRAVGGRLYLSGVSERLLERLRHSERLRLNGPVRTYEATAVLGESTRRALHDAECWLVDPDGTGGTNSRPNEEGNRGRAAD